MISPFALFVGVLTLPASGLAGPGDKGQGKAQGKNKFRFSLTTTDRRCDLTEPWATLTETRTYQVHANGDGTFRLRRVDKGRFTTVAGKSPGNCPANKSKHGQMVRANVTGRFGGYLEGTIMGGVFNRKATCPAAALVALNLGAGLASPSLGLISEALHSGADLVAALLTFFAVGVAVRPADVAHQYGHGKAEHLSALAEAAILAAASFFIAWRAVPHLVGGRKAHAAARGA